MAADWSTPDAELILSVEAGRDRALWLATRRQGIGGSDLATIMGVGKYVTPFDLWLDKTGRMSDRESTLQMELGARWEDGVAAKFSEDSGLAIQRRGMLRSKKTPLVLYNADRLVEDGMILECKAVNQFTKLPDPEGDEEFFGMTPQWYWQNVAGIYVTGRTGVYMACAIGNAGWATRVIYRDHPKVQEDMAKIAPIVEAWWDKYVLGGEVPEMGAPPQMNEIDPGSKYEAFIPEMLLEQRDRLRDIRETRRELKAEEDDLKAKLKAESGGKEWLLADGVPVLHMNPIQGRRTFKKADLFKRDPIDGALLREILGGEIITTADGDSTHINALRLREADFTAQGNPSVSLLIVGDREDE